MGGMLYCSANGRCIAVFPFLQGFEAPLGQTSRRSVQQRFERTSRPMFTGKSKQIRTSPANWGDVKTTQTSWALHPRTSARATGKSLCAPFPGKNAKKRPPQTFWGGSWGWKSGSKTGHSWPPEVWLTWLFLPLRFLLMWTQSRKHLLVDMLVLFFSFTVCLKR